MTQEDKDLLLKDLCARLPYGVKVQVEYDAEEFGKTVEIDEITMIDKYGEEILLYHASEYFTIEELKPYLRPMESMTKEEYNKLKKVEPYYGLAGGMVINVADYYDWLLKNHFDYMGLIPKGLAIEVTKKNNPYKD